MTKPGFLEISSELEKPYDRVEIALGCWHEILALAEAISPLLDTNHERETCSGHCDVHRALDAASALDARAREVAGHEEVT